MDTANIQFSEEELALMNNAGILLTKRSILNRVDQFLGSSASFLQAMLQVPGCPLPGDLLALGPKISRGEHYKGLPYRMLDYPRFFTPKDIFACRTFFWWGHHISITLHLKGIYLHEYAMDCIRALNHSDQLPWRITCGGDEWDHDASANLFLQQKTTCEWRALLAEADFCKISIVLEWGDWSGLPEKMEEAYLQLFKSWKP